MTRTMTPEECRLHQLKYGREKAAKEVLPAKVHPLEIDERKVAKKHPATGNLSRYEEALFDMLKIAGLELPVREFKFHPCRRWRFDFAYPDKMVAIEVEGGVWQNGRHNRGKGFTDDCEKYSEAAVLGWRIIRATSDQVKSGQAIEWIKGIF